MRKPQLEIAEPGNTPDMDSFSESGLLGAKPSSVPLLGAFFVLRKGFISSKVSSYDQKCKHPMGNE
jgi:hypothetical protein